jgi:hypothetical protein
VDGTEMEVRSCQTFLGSIISSDGYDNKEIKRRLSIGRMALTKIGNAMEDRDVKKATKIKIAETIIFPTVTYGSESWMVQKKERKKNDVFEIWTRKRILRFPWTEKRTNLLVLEEVKHITSLEATILLLKLS